MEQLPFSHARPCSYQKALRALILFCVAIPVILKDGHPQALLSQGEQVITGRFTWDSPPASLAWSLWLECSILSTL
jgi:hypothetical protein